MIRYRRYLRRAMQWEFIAPFYATVLLGALLAALAHAQVVIPDPKLTPGVIASTNQAEVCGFVGGQSYSQRHRVTPPSMKDEVRQRYHTQHCGEIDHRLPLALGGADVVENLSCESGPPEPFNFHVKDRLEVFVWDAVCKRHEMTLADAQAIFMEPDWRKAFCRLIGGPPC